MEKRTDPECGCGGVESPAVGARVAATQGVGEGPHFVDPTQDTRDLSLVRDRATLAAILPWLGPALYGPRGSPAGEDAVVRRGAARDRAKASVDRAHSGESRAPVAIGGAAGGQPGGTQPAAGPDADAAGRMGWRKLELPDPDDLPPPADPVPVPEEETDYTVSPPIQSCAGLLPGENVEADGAYFITPFVPNAPGNAAGYRTHKVGASLLSTAEQDVLDTIMATHMLTAQEPNGMLAIVESDGRLVHCFGYTNVALFDEIGEPRFYAGPHSAFRIASVSKTITAWTVQKLIDLGLLQRWHHLSTYVDLERIPAPIANGEVPDLSGLPWADVTVTTADLDARREDIRLTHLLTHTAGWFDDQLERDDTDADLAKNVWDLASPNGVRYDDLVANPGMIGTTIAHLHPEVAAANRASWPVTHDHQLRYMNLWPLAFDPGSTYSYSNWGFWLLGRVVEAATCRRYDAVVESLLLRPLGMTNTRVGRSRKLDRGVDEAPAFVVEWPTGSGDTQSLSQSYDDGSGYTGNDYAEYEAYAERNLPAEDAPGGWLSTAFDLALYLRETFHAQSLLSADLYTEMLSPLVPTEEEASDSTYCGYAWNYSRSDRPGCHWKTGHILGGRAYVFNQGAGGRSLVYAFNREPTSEDSDVSSDLESQLRNDLLDALDAISATFPGPFAPPDLFTRLQQ